MKKYVIIAGALCGFLAFTNPGMEEFSTFARSESQSAIREEVGDTAIGRAVAEFGSSLAGDLADDVTSRKNYVLFSTYSIGDDEPAWRFLGIAGRFVQLDKPDGSARAD